ncbi:hypothetical protein INR49_025275 [Caranx melampygus]|nr:hypothetical protein INR49_025275 [Caranx melampygus]
MGGGGGRREGDYTKLANRPQQEGPATLSVGFDLLNGDQLKLPHLHDLRSHQQPLLCAGL